MCRCDPRPVFLDDPDPSSAAQLKKYRSDVPFAFPGEEPTAIRRRRLANAAGLYALALVRDIDGVTGETIRPPIFVGGLFSLAGLAPFRRLVYPVPAAASKPLAEEVVRQLPLFSHGTAPPGELTPGAAMQ